MRKLVLSFAIFGALQAATPLFNGSFDGSAKHWDVIRGSAVVDASVTHDKRSSLRVEPGPDTEAFVRSAPIQLVIGKRYELSGWVRTSKLEVRDIDRSPIASGATLTMASMPFDMHSASVGGTRDWTRLTLRFTATRPMDSIVLSAGNGGRFRGQAWFEGVNIDEVSGSDAWPLKAAVKTFGPAYRYPLGGWIYLHIEGQPYERGYQHGYLMAHEIVQYMERCASRLDAKSKDQAWENGRTEANALFLRGFDHEILEEMKGIADGAAAAGAKWGHRPVDLSDIVTANTIIELSDLHSAMPMTPTGLEGLGLTAPKYFDAKRDVPPSARCSAFCATGKATRDGHMVIGHLTMWSLTLAEQTNVLLDLKPSEGHRILMQAYPGGVQSGMDYYQNDAGVVLTETTIRQSPFNINGTPESYRARKAIQYGDNVDQVVKLLGTKNNGLYTNEWLIGDAKKDEIAMYELGTYKTKLYRSSQNEWFGGTEGFYWGCNNAKDLAVRLEYAPDPRGPSQYLPFVPEPRDIKWQQLYDQYKGKIDEQFGFLALRTAPLVSATTLDAKLTTAAMAKQMMSWVEFGKPNQREWVPSASEKQQYAGNNGIYSSGYRLAQANASDSLRSIVEENEKARVAGQIEKAKPESKPAAASYKDRLWKGWILPASDTDIWLSAGSAAYYAALNAGSGAEHSPNHRAAGRLPSLDKILDSYRSEYRAAALEDDTPLSATKFDLHSRIWYQLASAKGALLLDALRRQFGDDRFFSMMQEFFDANTTKAVTTAAFREAANKAAGRSLDDFFSTWLNGKGLPGDHGGALYVAADLSTPDRLSQAVIVYGTVMDAGANRYAAEQLQNKMLDWYESAIPIYKDFEVTADDLRSRNVIFVGRPETNSALAAWKDRIGLHYDQAVFHIGDADHGSESEALLYAAANPLNSERMVLVVAGNSALETVLLTRDSLSHSEYAVYDAGQLVSTGFSGAR
ncbi:MAG TPA: C45 family autoproteolytic acyltransferase/hydrolase [Bryobacteraceae bacterium]|nr:C45 family autoproteolytic acyltransferase/hydrolase [Bryobacteraceae bacterium]